MHTEDASVECSMRRSELLGCQTVQYFISFYNHNAAYPSNVVASAASNTSITIGWGMPAEFYSSIVNYRSVQSTFYEYIISLLLSTSILTSRLHCRSNASNLNTSIQTVDNATFSSTASALSPFTTYTCCVEAIYAEATGNSVACSTTTTLEGSKEGLTEL